MRTTLTIEQSAKLIELGVPKERASKQVMQQETASNGRLLQCEFKDIFTIADLLSMFQKTIESEDKTHEFNIGWDDFQKSWIVYWSLNDEYIKYSDYELIDALYRMLSHLIENNYIKPQEL